MHNSRLGPRRAASAVPSRHPLLQPYNRLQEAVVDDAKDSIDSPAAVGRRRSSAGRSRSPSLASLTSEEDDDEFNHFAEKTRLTNKLMVLSCAQQLDWVAHAHLRSSATTTHGGSTSPQRGAPVYEHQLPTSVLAARVATVESKLAQRVRSITKSATRQHLAMVARYNLRHDEVIKKRQGTWLSVVATVVPVIYFIAALRWRRADRVIQTIFVVHVLHHFRRRAARQLRMAWTRERLKQMSPITPELIITAIPGSESLIQALPQSTVSSTLRFPLTMTAFERLKLHTTYATVASMIVSDDAENQPLFVPAAFRKGDYPYFSKSLFVPVKPDRLQAQRRVEGTAATSGGPVFVAAASPSALQTALSETAAFLIQEGTVRVSYRAIDVPVQGDQAIARYTEEFGPGSIIGLEGLLGPYARPHVAICVTDVTGFAVRASDLSAALHRLGDAAQRLVPKGSFLMAKPAANSFTSSLPDGAPAQSRSSDAGSTVLSTHPALLSLIEQLRVRALRAVPIPLSAVRSSSPFFALWSSRGLSALVSRMVGLTLRQGTAIPTNQQELAQIMAMSTDASSPQAAMMRRGTNARRLTTTSTAAPVTKSGKKAAGDGYVTFLVHGVLNRTDATSSTSVTSNGTPSIIRAGQCAGVAEAVLGKARPKLVAATTVDLWQLRETDLIEALTHEDLAALIPAFTM